MANFTSRGHGTGAAPGERRGGRQKGTPNKKSLLAQERFKGRKDPIDFLLGVMEDETQEMEYRIQCAGKLLPYKYQALKAIEHSVAPDSGPIPLAII